MPQRRRTHRSFLSYIDRSREYYGAHGYEKPFAWAAHDDAPFAPLAKPLAESRLGIVTTAYFLPDDFVYEVPSDLPRVPAVATRDELGQLNTKHLSWAKNETHTDDLNSFTGLERFDEAAAAGRIGSVSDRIYCLPTQFSHRQTETRDAPQIETWMREDDVDVAVMIPL